MTTKEIAKATIRLVEERLAQYPIDKRTLEAWEQLSKEIAGRLPSSAANLGEVLAGEGLHGDPTLSKVIRLERMAGRIDEVRWYVQAVDDVLDLLTPQERQLVELRFFKGESDTRVYQQLHIGKTKYYSMKRSVLLKFARRMGFL